MANWFLTFCLLFICTISISQDCLLNFSSPINYSPRLSGSYGEPRTQHFHAGIDYKQKRGIPYDTIFAIADGFVSRINVQPDGYGNALYIDHECNKTSVYAHLFKFAPNIQAYINDTMISLKKYAIAHKPESKKLSIKKGMYIGIMGSTGRSSGPHLHFEIRNSSSDTPINPALMGLKPTDNIPPVIRGIMIYELSPDNQELNKTYYNTRYGKDYQFKILNDTIFTNSYKLGIGIRAYDTMNGATNHNGIYSLNMKVDGEDAFSFSMDSISFENSKYIHTHMDYEEKMDKKYVTKCFINPGNKLNIYKSNVNKGMIFPFGFKNSKIEIEIKDIEGNNSHLQFYIKRKEGITSRRFLNENYIRIKPTDSLTIDLINSSLTFNPETFCQPTCLTFKNSSLDTIDLAQDYRIPLFKKIKLSHFIKPAHYAKEKYVFLAENDKGETERFRGRWEGDSTLVTFINTLKTYRVGIDSIKPKIEIISLPGKKSVRAKFKLSDNFLPVYEIDALIFNVYLDGKWILCTHDSKSQSVWFDMERKLDKRVHKVKIEVEDASRNSITLEKQFFF